jgi:uncharacterized membrane protein
MISDSFAIWFWRPMFEFLGTVALFIGFIVLWIIGDWTYYRVVKPFRQWYKKRKES